MSGAYVFREQSQWDRRNLGSLPALSLAHRNDFSNGSGKTP
jgi:hypothetical protein